MTTETLGDAPTEVLLRLYELMTLMKAADDRLSKGIASGEFVCVYWPSRGQEAVAAGVSLCLRQDDRLVTTYRGLHDLIGKGVPLTEIYGEMFGRVVGASRGKGGTMHIARPESGVMLSTGIVGSGPPVAVGLALAAQRLRSDRVTVASFGDGATNTGSFHEAANLAAVWQLPLVLLCQNNQYGEMTPAGHAMNVASIAERAAAYGIPGVRVDGNDPLAVKEAMEQAVARARAGGGPTLLECVTFRLRGHYFGDPMAYMADGELAAAIAADPVPAFRARLLAAGACTAEALDEVESRVDQQVEAAVAEVMAAPQTTGAELDRDVYADARNCPA